jgi:hypothetical protein
MSNLPWKDKSLKKLVIGATMREMNLYKSKPSVYFYVHGKEGKDVNRLLQPLTAEISAYIAKHSSPGKTYGQDGAICIDTIKTLDQMLDAYSRIVDQDAPTPTPRASTKLQKANVLLFEDVGYNFGPEDWCGLFAETGAASGYGYMCLPLEMNHPELPENGYYRYAQMDREPGLKGYSALLYSKGESNSYVHRRSTWELFMKTPLISHEGVTLEIELLDRVGPIVIFSLTRLGGAAKKSPVLRLLTLPEPLQYVRVLDLSKIERHSSHLIRPSREDYFSVLSSEFYQSVNYLMSLDEKSRTLVNALIWCRKRRQGLSMSTKEFKSHWWLKEGQVPMFAVTVYCYVMASWKTSAEAAGRVLANDVHGRILSRLIGTRFLTWLLQAFHKYDLTEHLVLTPSYDRFQIADVPASMYDFSMLCHHFSDGGAPDAQNCDLCAVYKINSRSNGAIQQEVKCMSDAPKSFTFEKTKSELETFRNDLQMVQQETAESMLQAAFAICLTNMPREDFEITVPVEIITGPPGSGKSVLIRQLADPERDMIVIPFGKLKGDYTSAPKLVYHPDGKITTATVNYRCRTQHHAFGETHCGTLFVDEFTCLDYTILALLVRRVNAERVVLVGDAMQCKIRDITEGTYVGDAMTLGDYPEHFLRVVYRFSGFMVAVLNRRYYDSAGKTMRSAKYEAATSDEERNDIGVKLYDMSKAPVPDITNCLPIAFSSAAAKKYTTKSSNTVRAAQGSSKDHVMLFVTEKDVHLLANESMCIVALSRHKVCLHVVHDGSEPALKFIADHWLDDEDMHRDFAKYLGQPLDLPQNAHVGTDVLAANYTPRRQIMTVAAIQDVQLPLDGPLPVDILAEAPLPLSRYVFQKYSVPIPANLLHRVHAMTAPYNSNALIALGTASQVIHPAFADYVLASGLSLNDALATTVVSMDDANAWHRLGLEEPSISKSTKAADVYLDMPAPKLVSVDDDAAVDVVTLAQLGLHEHQMNLAKALTYVDLVGFIKHDIHGQTRLTARQAKTRALVPAPLDVLAYDRFTTEPCHEPRLYNPDVQNVHRGQFKLLVAEFEFLKATDPSAYSFIVYVGGAPGHHIPYLVKEFGRPVLIVDPRPLAISHRMVTTIKVPTGVEFIQRKFTNRMAMALRALGVPFVMICDIRVDEETDDKSVLRDAAYQSQWVILAKPYRASLKIRPPFYEPDDHSMEDVSDLPRRADRPAYDPSYRWSEHTDSELDEMPSLDYECSIPEAYAIGNMCIVTAAESHWRHQVYAHKASAEMRYWVGPLVCDEDYTWDVVPCRQLEYAAAGWNAVRSRLTINCGYVASLEYHIASRILARSFAFDALKKEKFEVKRMTYAQHATRLGCDIWDSASGPCFVYAMAATGAPLFSVPQVIKYLIDGGEGCPRVPENLTIERLKRGEFDVRSITAYAILADVCICIVYPTPRQRPAMLTIGNRERPSRYVYYNGFDHYYAVDQAVAADEASDDEAKQFITRTLLVGTVTETPQAYSHPHLVKDSDDDAYDNGFDADAVGAPSLAEPRLVRRIVNSSSEADWLTDLPSAALEDVRPVNDYTLAQAQAAIRSTSNAVVYSPSGSGKTTWLRKVSNQYPSHRLVDVDDLVQHLLPRRVGWWLEPLVVESVESAVAAYLRTYLQLRSNTVVFTGYRVPADYNVVLSVGDHMARLLRRYNADRNTNQPVDIKNLRHARSYRPGVSCKDFSDAMRQILQGSNNARTWQMDDAGLDYVNQAKPATFLATKPLDAVFTVETHLALCDDAFVDSHHLEDGEIQPVGHTHPVRDAHTLSLYLVSTLAAEQVPALNEVQNYVVHDGFRSMQYDEEQLLAPVNMAHHPSPTTKTFRAVAASEGLNFSGISPIHAVRTARNRYDKQRLEIPVGSTSLQVARGAVAKYVMHCKVFHMTFDEFLELHAHQIAEDFFGDASTKKYFEKYAGENGWEFGNAEKVRFFMKQSFKPFVSTKGVKFDKTPQGVSAWSVTLLMCFCIAFRCASVYDMLTDRKDDLAFVATDNGVPFPRFARMVAARMAAITRYPVDKIIGDAVEFDGNQDNMTQTLERCYMSAIGLSDSFLDMYFQYRSNVVLYGNGFQVRITYEKLSGEPATLWANGIIMKVLIFYVARGAGEFLLIYKGDDVLLVQGQLTIDQDLLEDWNSRTLLRVVILFVDVGEFCGMAMAGGLLVPNAHRVLCKILAYRAPVVVRPDGTLDQGYLSFAKFQISIRDQLLLWRQIGWDNVTMAACKLKNCQYEEAELILDAVVAWAHVDEAQWLAATTVMTEETLQPHMERGRLVVD